MSGRETSNAVKWALEVSSERYNATQDLTPDMGSLSPSSLLRSCGVQIAH
jgi:hypothetical protein